MKKNKLELKTSLDILIKTGLFFEEDFELLQSLGIRNFIIELKSRHIYSLLERNIITEDDLKEIQFYEDLLNIPKIKQFEIQRLFVEIHKKKERMKSQLDIDKINELKTAMLIYQNVLRRLIREGCLTLKEIFWVRSREGLIYLILEAQKRLEEKNMLDEALFYKFL